MAAGRLAVGSFESRLHVSSGGPTPLAKRGRDAL